MKRREFLKLVALGVPAVIAGPKLFGSDNSVRIRGPLDPFTWRVQINPIGGLFYDCQAQKRKDGYVYVCQLCHDPVVEFRSGFMRGCVHRRQCGQLVVTFYQATPGAGVLDVIEEAGPMRIRIRNANVLCEGMRVDIHHGSEYFLRGSQTIKKISGNTVTLDSAVHGMKAGDLVVLPAWRTGEFKGLQRS